jgi:hypothetical protein
MSKRDGGPAFPVLIQGDPDGDVVGFQTGPISGWATGMTLRDYFAAKAMTAIVSTVAARDEEDGLSEAEVAQYSYELADAMLARREFAK